MIIGTNPGNVRDFAIFGPMITKFPLSSFRSMRFNVACLDPKKTVQDKYFPQFKWYDRIKFLPEYDKDKCLRLVILLFDPGSPLMAIDSMAERAFEACKLCFIEPIAETGSFPDWVKECLSLQNTNFNMTVMYYLSMIENTKVATLRSLKVAQLNVGARLMSGDVKAVTELATIEKEVERRQKELVGSYQVSPKQWLDIDQFLIDVDLDLSPEAMAQIREDHQKLFPQYDVYR